MNAVKRLVWETDMQTMRFNCAEHQEGAIASTFRNGMKWAHRLCVDEPFEIRDSVTGIKRGYGRVQAIHIARLWEIPAYLVELDHDPSLRNYESLKHELRKIYGGHVCDSSVFTAIQYRVEKSFEGPHNDVALG